MANKNSKGLGRGIDALFTEFDQIDVQKEVVLEIQLAEIRPNPYQPRKVFDEKALSELARSIEISGVFQPIILRKSTAKGYEIIAGERRYRASQLAKKETIPAIIRDFDEETMMEIAVLENLQREDLTPLEEAEAYEMLMKNLKLTQAEVSSRLGKSRPYIANYLRLLGLPKEVKQMLQSEELSMGQARTLLALNDKSKITALANRTLKEHLTVRQLEKIVTEMNDPKDKIITTRQIIRSPYIMASEKVLENKFDSKVQIVDPKGKSSGKIEIEYLTPKDLMRILDLLDVKIED